MGSHFAELGKDGLLALASVIIKEIDETGHEVSDNSAKSGYKINAF
jgi:hypothetical protein